MLSDPSLLQVLAEAYALGRQAGLKEAEEECRARIGAHLDKFERNVGANFALNEVAEALLQKRRNA